MAEAPTTPPTMLPPTCVTRRDRHPMSDALCGYCGYYLHWTDADDALPPTWGLRCALRAALPCYDLHRKCNHALPRDFVPGSIFAFAFCFPPSLRVATRLFSRQFKSNLSPASPPIPATVTLRGPSRPPSLACPLFRPRATERGASTAAH